MGEDRRILGFEADIHRPSPIQAGTRREISHSNKKNRLKVIGAQELRKEE